MKDKIVNAACELYLQLGFKSVTMDDLAQQLGISKKTIYSHFSNKTELVEECVCSLFNQVSHGIDCIRELGLNPIEELYEIKKYALIHLRSEKSSPHHQLKKYYPNIYSSLNDKQYDKMKDCVLENITRGMAQGIYRENLDANFVSRIYFAGNSSLKDEKLFPREQFPMVRLMDSYLEYHLRGIVTPKGRTILNNIINSNQE